MAMRCHTDRCPSGVATHDTKLQKALDEIMENGLQKVHMPYVKGKGKSVRIKNTIFRESKKDGGYLLFDVGTHKRVGTTFSKRGAIAYAKARAIQGEHIEDQIRDLINAPLPDVSSEVIPL